MKKISTYLKKTISLQRQSVPTRILLIDSVWKISKVILGNDDEVDRFSECMNLHVGMQARTLE